MDKRKIEISSTVLYKKLNLIYSVIESKPLVPVLEDFLFEFDKDILKITASNLQTTLSIDLKIQNDSIFNIAIPAKILIDTLKNLTDQFVFLDFDCDKNLLKIKSQNGEYRISCESAEGFPLVKINSEAPVIKLNAENLKNAIKNTIIVANNDNLKPIINSVFFQIKEKGITSVATDIHRLIKFEQNLENLNITDDFNLIIQKKSLSILVNLLNDEGNIYLYYDQKYVYVKTESFIWIAVLINEKYPEYERVIPQNNTNKMIINRDDLLWSLKRLTNFTSDLTYQVKFEIIDDTLKIFADDVNFENNAEESLNIFYEGESNLKIAYNVKYILEILQNLSCEEVIFLFSNVNENYISNKASIIKPNDEKNTKTTILVMPMLL